MSASSSVRSLIPLVIGLAIGGAGAVFFMQSLPGEKGSPEAKVTELEAKLKRAENQILALDAQRARRSRRTFADGARTIAEDIREGKLVDPNDIFRTFQPIMRDLSPLLDRMRIREQEQLIEQRTGEMARKYDLTPEQQESLKAWFAEKSEEEAKRWSDLVAKDSTTLQDLTDATQNVRPDQGLDEFMAKTLSGEKLAQFKSDRLTEKSQRVQAEADGAVERLDAVVGLDDKQRDQIFGIRARSSADYDPAMQIEGGVGEIGSLPGGDAEEATLSVLRPDQRAAYEADLKNREEQQRKDFESMGLKLPPNWRPDGPR